MANKKITFQIVSDLHMERRVPGRPTGYKTYSFPKSADYLLLVGDIGNVVKNPDIEDLRGWLIENIQPYKRVFYIAGNDEFQTGTIAAGIAQMRNYAADARLGGKLIVLEEDRYDLTVDGCTVSILGCVLWTRVGSNAQSDDWKIDSNIRGNSQAAHNARFEKSSRWLRNEVKTIRANHPDRPILVMTHHAPALCHTNRPDRDHTGLWTAYQVDILGGEGVEGLKDGDVWAYGHTHYSNSHLQDEVRIISNQRGGEGGEQQSGFLSLTTFDM